ncbi:MAG TPA: SDR family oxidoreductase [Ktedonobacterales bacterium]
MAQPPFRENVVIVTGSSRGIGRELAYQLASQGAWLVLAARSQEKLEQVAEECRKRGGKALVVQTDVTDESQCQRLIERTVEAYGRLDTLVNNAGYGLPKRIEAMRDLADLKAEMELNYYGTVHCAVHALPHLRQSKGRIVGVCSFGGLIGIPGTGGYNSAKHAMRGFLNTLRVELRGSGVSVTVAYLGAIRTERLIESMGPNVEKVPTMAPERCAALILKHGGKRHRQVVMTLAGKSLVWVQLLAPALLDRTLASLPINYQD